MSGNAAAVCDCKCGYCDGCTPLRIDVDFIGLITSTCSTPTTWNVIEGAQRRVVNLPPGFFDESGNGSICLTRSEEDQCMWEWRRSAYCYGWYGYDYADTDCVGTAGRFQMQELRIRLHKLDPSIGWLLYFQILNVDTDEPYYLFEAYMKPTSEQEPRNCALDRPSYGSDYFTNLNAVWPVPLGDDGTNRVGDARYKYLGGGGIAHIRPHPRSTTQCTPRALPNLANECEQPAGGPLYATITVSGVRPPQIGDCIKCTGGGPGRTAVWVKMLESVPSPDGTYECVPGHDPGGGDNIFYWWGTTGVPYAVYYGAGCTGEVVAGLSNTILPPVMTVYVDCSYIQVGFSRYYDSGIHYQRPGSLCETYGPFDNIITGTTDLCVGGPDGVNLPAGGTVSVKITRHGCGPSNPEWALWYSFYDCSTGEWSTPVKVATVPHSEHNPFEHTLGGWDLGQFDATCEAYFVTNDSTTPGTPTGACYCWYRFVSWYHCDVPGGWTTPVQSDTSTATVNPWGFTGWQTPATEIGDTECRAYYVSTSSAIPAAPTLDCQCTIWYKYSATYDCATSTWTVATEPSDTQRVADNPFGFTGWQLISSSPSGCFAYWVGPNTYGGGDPDVTCECI